MRQLTCVGAGRVDWCEVAEPRLEAGDGNADGAALVRPLAVARCEIDPVLIAGASGEGPGFALGHEAVVEVLEVGPDVATLAPGTRAVLAFQLSCGGCARCRRGHSANCERYPVLSDYGMQPLSGVEYGGMLSDVVRVPHADAMLREIPADADPVALASVADNVLDGYRTVAPHLAANPGADVLFACHGAPSIALYGVQAARALGAGRIDFASDRPDVLALAEKLGAHPRETDFSRRESRHPIVVDCGLRPEGLRYALSSTEPEGVCQSVSYYAAGDTPLPLGKLYTWGIRFQVGRANAVSLLPEVMALIAAGRLAPERVTTRVAGWEDAPRAFLEPAIKLVLRRD